MAGSIIAAIIATQATRKAPNDMAAPPIAMPPLMAAVIDRAETIDHHQPTAATARRAPGHQRGSWIDRDCSRAFIVTGCPPKRCRSQYPTGVKWEEMIGPKRGRPRPFP